MHRGNLTLVLLPSSDLRLSFIGDDGRTERLFTLTNKSQCSGVMVDEIPTDSSGRSFLVRTPDSRIFYFWCSEKSKLLGIELLGKVILAILLDWTYLLIFNVVVFHMNLFCILRCFSSILLEFWIYLKNIYFIKINNYLKK